MGKQDKIAARKRAAQEYPHVDEVLNRKNLRRHVDNGIVKHVPHPQGTLRLYDYTAEAERRRTWDGVTTVCRGLLVDNKQNVVARPFQKFFSHDGKKSGAVRALRWTEPWEAQEKLDGTLVVAGNYHGERTLTTRASFDDWRLARAARLLGGATPPTGETWLFEYVGPENRIVVPYSEEQLVLIGVIDNWGGGDLPDRRREVEASLGLRPLRVFDADTKEGLLAMDPGDGTLEGFVVVQPQRSGPWTRLKVKMPSWLERVGGREPGLG